MLDHFGDARRRADAAVAAVCDPDTIDLPDPATLVRAAGRRPANVELAETDRPLFEALRSWRGEACDGKPAYTVAHNATLEAIAARRPQTLAELAAIRGVGPAFIERHGDRVLEVVRADRP